MASSRPKRNSNRDSSRLSAETNLLNESANTSAMDLALATLQPLRDLARNWDVDVASCLEEYLQELAGIHPHQLQKLAEGAAKNDPNATNDNEVPNFAHAALILQNSSNVYSRKVEYLYSLVYKALEEFFQASKVNSSSSKNGRKGKSVDADVEEFYDFDPHECFLLLDDVVPEDLSPTHRKINLKEEDEDEESRDRMSSVGGDNAPGSARSRNNMTRLSLGGLSVTRMERNNTFSTGGVSSQQQQRALLGILNNGGLRLMSGHCDVGDDGVLLMPGSQSARSSASLHAEIENNPDNSLNDALYDANAEGGIDSERRNLFDNDYNADDYDDHDEGPGFSMNDDFDADGDANMGGTNSQKVEVGVANLAFSHTTKRVAFADSVDDDLEKRQQRQEKKKKDPWQLLDPHSLGDACYKPKPLKRGKTYRLPEGITRPPSECVTGSSTSLTMKPERRSLAPPTLRPSLAVESFRVSMGKQLEPSNKVAYRGLAYGDEFLYIAKENAKLKAAKRRNERKREQQLMASAQYDGTQDSGDGSNNNDGMYDDDDNGGGIDFGGENDFDDEVDQDYAAGNSGLVNLEDAFSSRHAHDDDDRVRDEGSSYGKSFEELCRAHIEAFAKSAEKFALTTKLTERISRWQSHLGPILEQEERKASFDIHRYSEMLLDAAIETAQDQKRKSMEGHPSDTVCKNVKLVKFHSVAEGCTQSDICRLFLASLSLANSGNLKIEEGAIDYRFEILSSKVDKPMETYQAPSATAVESN